MDKLFQSDFPRKFHNTVLAIGIGSEGAVILEYLKGKALGKTDYLIPDENLTNRYLDYYRVVFLVGGTGDLPTPKLASILADNKNHGFILSTIGLVAIPSLSQDVRDTFLFTAELEEYKNLTDLLIVFPYDDLPPPDHGNSLSDAPDNANDRIGLTIKTILDLLTFPGGVEIDFDDIRRYTQNGGYGFFITGQASVQESVEKPFRVAMPEVSQITTRVNKDSKLLIFIYYDAEYIPWQHISEILQKFQEAAGVDCDILWNCGYDPTLKEDLRISAIWTGLDMVQISFQPEP